MFVFILISLCEDIFLSDVTFISENSTEKKRNKKKKKEKKKTYKQKRKTVYGIMFGIVEGISLIPYSMSCGYSHSVSGLGTSYEYRKPKVFADK